MDEKMKFFNKKYISNQHSSKTSHASTIHAANTSPDIFNMSLVSFDRTTIIVNIILY